MNRLPLILALTAVPAVAFAADTTFASVDDVTVDIGASNFTVTGIVSGEATARTVSFNLGEASWSSHPQTFAAVMAHCEKSALMSMNRPGRYLLTVSTDTYDLWLAACRLKRNQ